MKGVLKEGRKEGRDMGEEGRFARLLPRKSEEDSRKEDEVWRK